MISQLFFITERGDTIIRKDYRKDLPSNTNELFFRKYRTEKDTLAPIFNMSGITYFFKNCDTFNIIATSGSNISASMVFEMIDKLVAILKDLVGVLDEKNIRKNFTLVYEVVDEMIDFGNPQVIDTSSLKNLIESDVKQVDCPEPTKESGWFGYFGYAPETKSQNSTKVSILKSQNNEIYIDVIESIRAIVMANGCITKSDIFGSFNVKSYIDKHVPLKIIFDKDISISESKRGGVHLDSYNFKNTVSDTDFELGRSLIYHAAEGENAIMTYWVNEPSRLPFKIIPFVEDQLGPGKLVLKISGNLPMDVKATYVQIKIPKTKDFRVASSQFIGDTQKANQTFTNVEEDFYIWRISIFDAKLEYTLAMNIQGTSTGKFKGILYDIRNLILEFQVDNYLHSGFRVEGVRVIDKEQFNNPTIYMRYITKHHSYTIRMKHPMS